MGYTGDKKREYQRQWVANRRAAWLSDKVCVKCGSRDDLQVDHIDGAQKVSHRIWSWTAKRREAELAKCQVLCTPCHRSKTKADLYPEIHGSHTTYVRRGCRCDACKAVHAATNRRWRQQTANKRNVAQ